VVAFTRNLIETDTQIAPFLNADFGEAMNQDAAFGGTPIRAHDGIDTTLWTGSEIVGNKVTFNSGDRAQVGSNSIKVDNPALNDIWQIARGSDVDPSTYTAVTMFVNIDKDWSEGDSVAFYAWDSGLGVQVGATVLLESYMDEFQFDTWMSVVIPFADLGLTTTTFDSFRMGLIGKGGGKAPKFYLDEWIIQQTGTPLQYKTNTPRGTVYRINDITLTFVDATTATTLSHDKLLDMSQLTNGILITRTVDDVVTFASSLTDLRDFLKLGFEITNYQADGASAILTLQTKFIQPLTVFGGENSFISLTVSDDLSGFTEMTAIARGSIDL